MESTPAESNTVTNTASDRHVLEIQDDDDDFQEPSQPPPSPSRKRHKSDLDDDETLTQCSLCLDPWTNNGPHRIVSLQCGHLFGESCIVRWIQRSPSKVGKCPHCQAPARRSHCRPIWAAKVIAEDTSQIEALKRELEKERSARVLLEKQLDEARLHQILMRQKLQEATAAVASVISVADDTSLSKTERSPSPCDSVVPVVNTFEHFHVKRLEVTARTMALSPMDEMAVVSVGRDRHGIQKISLQDLDHTETMDIHDNVIRDVKASPSQSGMILSTGLDKTLKLTSAHNKTVLQSYNLDAAGWSCDFDSQDTNILYCGLANDSVLVYDIRNTKEHVHRLQSGKPGGKFSIHSLATTRSNDETFIFCATIMDSYAWRLKGEEIDRINLPECAEGFRPYSLSFDQNTQSMLLSTRRPAAAQCGATSHAVYRFQGGTCDPIWSFQHQRPQLPLARTAHFTHDGELDNAIICIADDANQSVILHNQEGLVQTLPVGGSALDIKSAHMANGFFLASLTKDQFNLNKYNDTT